ncbi:TonB-dependent receptor [Sulfurospirillum barnesii]|uniref:Outer membrane receptor protein n=1 Tax=Sulfurospirillum barnesii (strain ATCC 700032 / DSM 10660 / SES-3) TaxID=760154 RepID=I3XXZ5_SULBS|nr:TonB-dependent receptor [Sulfurospirillum barnesii]AFL68819.1 outer membrane receptor protein [Sulfurospirillum barnesii SES-3]
MWKKNIWKRSLVVCALLPSFALAENTTVELSEVTVMGEKIERSMQETTTAVSVFKGDSVGKADNKSIYDVASQVPNMINNPSDIPIIRGVNGAGPAIGGFAVLSGTRPRISTSVDGLSEAWNGQRYMDASSWDVEQIEVLRGPQSTTQGRNSIGGAVVVSTKDPTFEPEGAVRIGYENESDKALFAAMISGPVVENELAMRLSMEGVYGHSFMNYEGSNTPWDPSDMKQGSVRGKVLWIPKDIEGLTVKMTAAHKQSEGGYMNEISPNSDISDYTFLVSAPSNLVRYGDSKSHMLSTDVEYALNDETTFYFLAGYSKTKTTFEQAPTAMDMSIDEKSITLEPRLVHNPKEGLITSMAGLYFYHRAQKTDIAKQITMDSDDTINALAFYFEESLHVNTKLDVIFGGRIEREHQERDVTYNTKPMDANVAETMFLPKVGLNYKLTPEHTIGLTARKGYNPGGGSLTWDTYTYYEYDKEEVWTYEATTRSLMLNKRLSLNTNLFYNDYSDYQGIAGSGLGQRFTNVPEGKSYGFEAESSYRLSSDLEVHGALGFLRSEITKAPEGTTFKGNEFNHAPHFTGSLGFTQHFGGGFFFGSDVNYVGEYYTGINNLDTFKAGKYTLVNFNLGYETKDYTIRTYLKNAFDEEVLYNYRGTFAQVGQPRTFGVSFDYRF